MQEPSTPTGGETLARVERLVILQLAGTRRGCTRVQLVSALRGVGRQVIEDAIASLAAVGVVIATERSVCQSAALERLDRLGYIGVV